MVVRRRSAVEVIVVHITRIELMDAIIRATIDTTVTMCVIDDRVAAIRMVRDMLEALHRVHCVEITIHCIHCAEVTMHHLEVSLSGPSADGSRICVTSEEIAWQMVAMVCSE